MSRINNTIKRCEDHAIVLITKSNDCDYLKEIYIDLEDVAKITRTVYVGTDGYVRLKKHLKSINSLAHIVLNHNSNVVTIVDHINGNKLNNRKSNLRLVTQHQNATNHHKSKSNVNIVGISRRSKGNYNYFRASVSDLTTFVCLDINYKRTKRFSKHFNINKLGEDVALQQAKVWLSQKRKQFGYLSEDI